MGKRSKKANLRHKVLTATSIVLSVILALLIGALVYLNRTWEPSMPEDSKATTLGEESGENELRVESVTEQEDTVLVVTTYGTVKYPFAFSDLIRVEAENFADYAELTFGVTIEGTLHKLYTLSFNGEEGMPIGTLLHDGETYVITAQFHDASGISEDNMITFYAAQETFNDVVNSLSENEGFTAED